MPRSQPFGPHATVTETRCPDIYNARPGQKVGHALVTANSGAKLPGKSGKRSASSPPWGRVVSAEPGKVVLAFSLPSPDLSANGPKGLFWRKGKATAEARETACRTAQDAIGEAGATGTPWPKARASAAFYFARKGRRDPDNLWYSLKGVVDGLRDAGLLLDDDTEHLSRTDPTVGKDAADPRVVLTIERIAA